MRNWLRKQLEFNQLERDEWMAKQAARIPSGSDVLDAGAGCGPYRPLFAHCVYKTQDFGQEPATQGKYTPLDYVCDITTIPVPESSFDVVVCTEVLEHVPEPQRAIREFSRVLKPGGKLLLTAPLGCRLHQEPYHFYGGFTPYWYRRVLNEEGFSVCEMEPNRGFFSHFAQEGLYFLQLIDPRRRYGNGVVVGLLLILLWVLLLPLFRFILPALAGVLDRVVKDRSDTVGYHVVAEKINR